ncbi:MAG: hypothetical protein JW925_02740 [Syntrophaceae bacterium]|nr:hypothetical protein [Syntrophaceae bacterium]
MGNSVEYQITTSVNDGILEVILTGEVTKGTVEKLAIETAAIVIENGSKNILVDIRTLKGRLGVFETYAIVRNPYDKPKVNCAVVDLPENVESIRFLETTSLNAGLLLKTFIDMDAAKAWLKGIKEKR